MQRWCMWGWNLCLEVAMVARRKRRKRKKSRLENLFPYSKTK